MIASFGVVIGMWLERFLIVVPSLTHKQLPYSWGTYSPTPVELFIMAATFAAMVLLYALFAKFVPIISIWELKAGDHVASTQATSCHAGPHSLRVSAGTARGHARSRIMKAVYGLYADPHVAQQAVNNLRAAGVAGSRHHGDLVGAVRALRVRAPRREDRDAVDRRRAPARLGLVLDLLPARRLATCRGRS